MQLDKENTRSEILLQRALDESNAADNNGLRRYSSSRAENRDERGIPNVPEHASSFGRTHPPPMNETSTAAAVPISVASHAF